MTDFVDLLPGLTDEDFQRLKADIRERGVQIPWEVDEDGVLLDGKHRKRAVDELAAEGVSVEVPPAVVRRGLSDSQKRLHAVALNLARRHLTDAQKVRLGMQIKPDVEARARERQGQRTDLATSATTVTEVRRSSDEVAKAVGLGSGRTFERHERTLTWAEQEAPELVEKVDRGEADLRDVREEQRRREAEQRRAEQRARTAELAAREVPAPERLYPVVYADPPWRYEHAISKSREIENHYPTMSAVEIGDLEVPATDDSVLFMWATSPKLAEAMYVLDQWGFEYVTSMVWVKDKIGMGYYARQRHELLLIAKRGKPATPEPSNRPDSVIEAPRTRHSAKPPEVYDLIDRMYPDLPKVELFARVQRDGWDGWGNEAAA